MKHTISGAATAAPSARKLVKDLTHTREVHYCNQAIEYLDKEKLLRINAPQLGLEVPLWIVGSLEGLALLSLPAAPDHHKGIAQILGPWGSEVAGSLH